MRTAVFPGRFASLDNIRTFFSEGAKEAGLTDKSQFDIQLATDEAASNIIDHAYGGEDKGTIECSYKVFDDRLELFLRDSGKPFDPKDVEIPDLTTDVCFRKPRGLGLHFIRNLMDEVNFSFDESKGNLLKMVKKSNK